MANSLFNAMGGSRQNGGNVFQQFQSFMQQMKGRNPNEIISNLVSSGKVSQAQLNEVQQRAQQMSGMFEPLKGMFR